MFSNVYFSPSVNFLGNLSSSVLKQQILLGTYYVSDIVLGTDDDDDDVYCLGEKN